MALAGALKCFFVMGIAWWRSSPQQNGVEVESILGVFWSSPLIFSFLACLLDIREALCTSAYRLFFSLFSSAVSTGLTRVSTWGDKRCRFSALLSLWLCFCFLLLALDIPRSVHVTGPPFSLYCPHTPFYRAYVAGSIVVSTKQWKPFQSSLSFVDLYETHQTSKFAIPEDR